ncbi:MAG: DUF4398 domain-containing protein [Deltaproteobacteria bacterium]
MCYKNGIENHKSCRLLAALLAGVLLMSGGVAIADSTWFSKLLPKNSMLAHEKAKAARMEALENAKIAFEKAKSAGAESAAPYEYYTAEEYIHLADEELKSGDKIGVALFAAEAEAYSFEALEKTRRVSK